MAKASCGGILYDNVTITTDTDGKTLKVDASEVNYVADYVADSTAEDVATVVSDLNTLKQAFVTAGLMASE